MNDEGMAVWVRALDVLLAESAPPPDRHWRTVVSAALLAPLLIFLLVLL